MVLLSIRQLNGAASSCKGHAALGPGDPLKAFAFTLKPEPVCILPLALVIPRPCSPQCSAPRCATAGPLSRGCQADRDRFTSAYEQQDGAFCATATVRALPSG